MHDEWSNPTSWGETCRRSRGRREFNKKRQLVATLRRQVIARRLRQVGLQRGVQAELSRMLHVSKSTVSQDVRRLLVRSEGHCPGLTQALIERSLNYDPRTSDKTYYVSPSRGQLGNALKCVWAVPYAVDPEAPGCVQVRSLGWQHRIRVGVDQIAQEARLAHRITEVPFCKKGTTIAVMSPKVASAMTRGGRSKIFTNPCGS